jgi:predicted ester cyclase
MSRIACAVAVAAWLGAGGAAAGIVREKGPELQLADRLDAAINGGKAADAATLFADDASVRAPDGAILAGRAQIDPWLASVVEQGWHMDAGNRQLRDGGRVTWIASIVNNATRTLVLAPLDANVEAVIADGRIKSLAIRLSTAAQLRLTVARAKADEAIARVYVSDVLGKRDVARMGALLAPGFLDHDPLPGKTGDAAGFRSGITSLRGVFPDLVYTVEDVLVSGDRTVVRGKCRGTQQGSFLGSTASGRAFTVGFIEILRMADGRIAERWGQKDVMKMLDQLGFVCGPPPPPPPPPLTVTVTGQPAKPVEKKKSSWF